MKINVVNRFKPPFIKIRSQINYHDKSYEKFRACQDTKSALAYRNEIYLFDDDASSTKTSDPTYRMSCFFLSFSN